VLGVTVLPARFFFIGDIPNWPIGSLVTSCLWAEQCSGCADTNPLYSGMVLDIIHVCHRLGVPMAPNNLVGSYVAISTPITHFMTWN
jgi:hypothetical protein